MDFIAVGRVIAPWGSRGEVKVEVLTDFPDRFEPEGRVYIEGRALTIESCKWHRGRAILKLTTTDSVEDAQKLRGQLLEVPISELHPLPQDQYYQFQLLGLEVWTTEGEHLGRIARILPTGSNDVYVVPREKGEVLVPAIEDVVKSIDIDNGRMTIEAVKGLLAK
jgi:16S rRNA processing protein RimM